MTKKLYKLMNWAEIEAIVYSEDDNPHHLLGLHPVTGGMLLQCFYPGAERAFYVTKEEVKAMELVDEEGYFALLLPKNAEKRYSLKFILEDKEEIEIIDPYQFAPTITQKDTEKFNKGVHYSVYNMLGAHLTKIDGVEGVSFAVWAPNAVRVSVVGEFNGWDGRIHQMSRLWDSGIFEIFIPGVKEKDAYKFDVKIKGGLTLLKADPYAFSSELHPDTNSVVANLEAFTWSDERWLETRKKFDLNSQPLNVYELHLNSFMKQEDMEYINYRELAQHVAAYVKEMGYTHIELMPIMEHPLDGSWGYQVTGYYAPTSRYGKPDDFMCFVNIMHENGIGVILDWVPSQFPRDAHGLSNFDGTSLYEYADPRQAYHSQWGTLIFDYGRPEVENYLIANALYWLKVYHIDGIRMDGVASMLYLDYGKNDGEWIPNIYGGKENLEAIEFIKHLNSIVKKERSGAIMIAEESTSWPRITGDIENDGLGFDLKWNLGWTNDFLGYMRFDPYFRGHHHGELIFSMIYAYSEKFMLTFSHDDVIRGKASMLSKMPGELKDKFKNLRMAYAYMMMHPGKKHLFMGQDLGEFDEWGEERSVEWDLLEYDSHKRLNLFVKKINRFYKEHPALYKTDFDSDGFEWINNISANENVIVFLRKTKVQKETLLVVCNFANEKRDSYKVGVPFAGKYKEILNSDAKEFGGSNIGNAKLIFSQEEEYDDRENSIYFKMPALSVLVFSFIPFTKAETDEIAIRKEEARKIAEEENRKRAAREACETARQEAEDAMAVYNDARIHAEASMKRALADEEASKELLKEAQRLERFAKKLENEEAKKEETARKEIEALEQAAKKTESKVSNAKSKPTDMKNK